MLETSEVEHADAAVCTTGNENIDAVGAEANVEDFFVMGNKLRFGSEGRDVPYCTRRVYAGRDNEAGGKCVPVEGGERRSVLR